MPKLTEVYRYLDSISPFSLQQQWDNSGLLIGNMDFEIKDIYLSLEVTKELALKANKDSLIISHHPLIFKSLKNLDFSTYPSNIIEILIKKNISLIAMHTNFDMSHLNKYFTQKILGFDKFYMQDIACIVDARFEFDILLKKFNHTIRFSKCKDFVNKIVIVCGAGISEIDTMYNRYGIDCIITGDIKYHDVMKYKSLGISVIDVNHYNSECFFGEVLASYLKDNFYNVIIFDIDNPFSTRIKE